jgi:hypothetical protein
MKRIRFGLCPALFVIGCGLSAFAQQPATHASSASVPGVVRFSNALADLGENALIGIVGATKAGDAEALEGASPLAFLSAPNESTLSTDTAPPAVHGTGTPGFVPVWTATGTVGNSVLQSTSNGLIVGGLLIGSTGVVNFAPGQSFPGTGAITQVTAGTDLTGGGTSGNVTLNLDTTKVPELNAANVFTNNQTINGQMLINTTLGALNGFLSVGGGLINGQHVLALDAGADSWQAARILNNFDGGLPTLEVTNFTTTSGAPILEVLAPEITVNGNQAAECLIDTLANLMCNGSKSAVVPVNGGSRQVALYAVEAAENWFEDFGSGRLVNGIAIVTLDPVFAETVNTESDYHVFLTPNGDCKGLFVVQKAPTSFVVRELGGGTSAVAFDYRIVAHRRGYENIRLADLTARFQKRPLQPR